MPNDINTTLNQLRSRLSEACGDLWHDFVDPRDAYAGEDGEWWAPLVASGGGGQRVDTPLDEHGLARLRDECRRLAVHNEFAINGHENRVNYIVGAGHVYLATPRKGRHAPDALAGRVQAVLDEFQHENRWHSRQQEVVRRLDRDGEAFLRFFTAGGVTRVRVIEPDQVAAPERARHDPRARFGVVTEPGDVERVQGYYVDGRFVPGGEVQHRKANVDANVRRGLPLYAGVRSNLRRAERLLRNMSAVAEVQSAIALIRRHRTGTRTGVEQFADQAASSTRTDAGGRTERITQYGPGAILDAPAGLEYEFPATGIDASRFVAVLQAELRAIAARLVMPEFMFTSDASNGSYASTMVAEGPAVRMFERLQANLMQDDCEVMWRVIDNAARAGRLPRDVRQQIEIQITPPSLHVRDPLKEAQVNKIAHAAGVLSPQTWSQRLGLDYDQEQMNLKMHEHRGEQ
ncbi:Phage portal protein, lambda family [Posidoniimonas polymericola]|uniref:Phage portal protein, lambda family n=1 Tax=Posidoniimonas polymericola TaxID=2528002 RepID=A0A5C5ZE34_9BACT|nr:phage portal protein [Posidoniimonas polymericola]TWT85582.1 Phage portal protein, lambda family [Posidoniimonas polymericola]